MQYKRQEEIPLPDGVVSSGSIPNRAKRALYVDAARGFAIALGLFSHVMLTTGAWENLKEISESAYSLRLLTRVATPTFILIFGISMELAYVRRWLSDGSARTVRIRLIKRSWKCYRWLAYIGLAGILGGVVTWADWSLGMAFMAPIFNADIFAFYAVAMVISIVLIPFRVKFGLTITMLATLCWWPIEAMLSQVLLVDGKLGFFLSRIFGIGDSFGPSVFHSLPLVVAGMMIGSCIKERGEFGGLPRGSRTRLYLLLAGGTAALLTVVIVDGPKGSVINFVSANAYRNTNHVGYYAFGFLFAVVVLAAAYALTEFVRRRRPWQPGPFGTESLLAFGIGNVLINLIAGRVETNSVVLVIAGALLYIAVLWVALTYWINWKNGKSNARLIFSRSVRTSRANMP